jgi:ribosome-associated toxin RatA of RatAB toxin-antitoxin module
MSHFKLTTMINASVEKVDAVVGDVNKWPHFIPGYSQPTRITGTGSVGTSVDHRMKLMLGISQAATTKVAEERHEGDGATYWKWMQEGSVCSWWSCHHHPEGDQTLAETEFDYTMPGGPLGRAFDRIFVAARQKRVMREAIDRVKSLAESS